jgi:ribonucleoside-diphosphate reductase beta chain
MNPDNNYDEMRHMLDLAYNKKGNDDKLGVFLQSLVEKYGLSHINNLMNPPELDEPILNPANHKFTAFPINYQSVWDKYKEQQACFWKAEEIDFSGDYADFKSLTKDEQYFIEMVLAFFASSDGIVNFNLTERFTRDVQITEAQFAYQFQIMIENVHSETYSLMLDNIVKDAARKDFLFRSIETVPSVKRMADWSFKWIDSPRKFSYRVVAFACVELIFFSGAFAAIFWIKSYKNKSNDGSRGHPFMKGLITSNKFIARDEGLHGKYACELYSLLQNKLPRDEVNKIVMEAVIIAKSFMEDALPIRLIGMNGEMMGDYIEYIADRLLSMLNYPKIYNKSNPFKFMEKIGLDDKTNFFELRGSEYQDPHVMNKSKGKKDIVIKDDF